VNCPVCANVALQIAERQGIEIDHCPKCRGVWLDRGELDKLIERSASHYAAQAAYPAQARRSERDDDYEDRRRHESDGEYDREGADRGRRRKRGFLNDLFDFD
jgi:Zn-finger nucleic acid-binding protein